MSKLLIIGASILQLPAIIKAKELGHYVVVADYNCQAVGVKYADEYFNASTIDTNAICEVAKQCCPDGIMTLATDMPMRALASATSLLGLSGISIETAIKATDKGEMIMAFKENNVETPWYHIIKNESDLQKIKNQLTFPCILKPTDNAGSRGVVLIKKTSELLDSYLYSQKHSRSGNVIIEEYLDGPEVSVEVMIIDGIVHILAVTDKLTTGAPHFVEMGHSQQSQLAEEDIIKIKNLTKRAVKAIGINKGPAHVEIILTKDGPKMVELGARMGGDCITTHLVPLSTGIDMIKATIDICLGIQPDIMPKFNKGSAIRFFNSPIGKLQSIDGVKDILHTEGIKEVVFNKTIGDEVAIIQSSTDRIGYIITQGKDACQAIKICEGAMKKVNISMQ